MSYRRVDSGNPLILRCLLFDGNVSQFPVAHIYDSSGAEVAGSPVSLTASALGRYRAVGPSLADGEYDALYITYSDSGHSTENTNYDRVSDDFDVRPLGATAAVTTDDAVILVPEDDETILLVGECS